MISTWRCKKKIFLGTTSSKRLRSLANRYYTIITKADKRSLVVVIDICDYINEANIELNNTSFYNKTDTDPTKVNCVKSDQVRSIFLVRIFPHSDWIRRDTPYLSVFSPNEGKCGPEKTPVWTIFTLCVTIRKSKMRGG